MAENMEDKRCTNFELVNPLYIPNYSFDIFAGQVERYLTNETLVSQVGNQDLFSGTCLEEISLIRGWSEKIASTVYILGR